MSYTWRNRTVGYDNIAVGSVLGIEKIAVGTTGAVQNPVDDITIGNFPQPENLERVLNAAGSSANVGVASSGLERLTP